MARCPKCSRTFEDTKTTCPHDGEVLVRDGELKSDPDLKRGDTVGEYVVEGKIGSGTFGDVYRAIQPLIGKQVAIKVLSRKYSADPHIVSRFIAEARAVNQIRHKNIIDIFSFGQLSDGRHYHIMELLSGTTLDDHLKKQGRLPIAETIHILQALARALDAAHAAGIAHRDLKPANIFLGRDDDGKAFPKLLDFGIAKLMSEDMPRHHQTATGAAVGTPDYMSPEQCQGPDVDHRTDIYAFGIMTYQLLTGKLPFIGANVVEVLVKQMTATAEPPSSVVAELPPGLDAPILRMIAKAKEDRPQSLAAAMRALEDAARAAGVVIAKSSTTGDPETPAFAMRPPPPMISAPPPETSFLADTLPSSSGGATEAKQVFASLPDLEAKSRKKQTTMLIGGVALLALIPLVVVINKLNAGPPESAPIAEPAPVLIAEKPVVEAAVKEPEPATIALEVSTTPEHATIFLGGVELGRSPCVVHIRRGSDPVMLELRADGHETLEKEILPLADGKISVALKKLEPVRSSVRPVSKVSKASKAVKKKAAPSKRPHADEIENAFGE